MADVDVNVEKILGNDRGINQICISWLRTDVNIIILIIITGSDNSSGCKSIFNGEIKQHERKN